VLSLAGVRRGWSRGRVELSGHARAGALSFARVGRAVCVAITVFPTPLDCQLATGYTAFAADLGAGVGVGLGAGERVRLNIEAGDLLVRYGLEAFRPNGETTTGFVSHNLQAAAGLAWRF
jgi:hypothetical protein